MVSEQIKKIFSHSLVYGIGNILNRFLGFILLPVYTHYFNPAQFGVFSLVYAFWFFAAVFYLFGMETSFQKFFVEAKTEGERKKIFGSTSILILITSVVFSAIIYFNSGFISRLITGSESNFYLLKLLAVLLVIDSLSRFPMIVLNALQKSRLYTI
ncbi:MAG: lipopolysaccharide biosynthesis protein, partial [Ignavibacteria bacterium]